MYDFEFYVLKLFDFGAPLTKFGPVVKIFDYIRHVTIGKEAILTGIFLCFLDY
jgi:hypothetical protein